MAIILIAEDERPINTLMAANLRLVGHECDQCLAGDEALALAAQREYDLILLDARLPRIDGFALKQRLPAGQPVLFVTDRAGLTDQLRSLGPDGYIVKPFEIPELLALVDRVLRRAKRSSTEFLLKDLRVDLSARRVFCGGREAVLTPQEYALLETLIVNRNLALSREKLLAIAWGYDYEGETRTVDVHINRLRRKLGLAEQIQTVYKVGYRLNTKE